MNYFDVLLSQKLNKGGNNVQVSEGNFTTAAEQYGIVDINCGFRPDLIIVALPFGDDDTTSYWWKEASWAGQYACWNLFPAEWNVYFVELERLTGETGIQAINDNGFSFMSNGGNTQGIECKYMAVKYKGN